MISLTRKEAITEGFRTAYYNDVPNIHFKIKDMTEDQFEPDAIEEYGLLFILDTDIQLTP